MLLMNRPVGVIVVVPDPDRRMGTQPISILVVASLDRSHNFLVGNRNRIWKYTVDHKDSLRLGFDERTFDGLPDLVHQVLRYLGTQLSGLEILHYLRNPLLVSIGGKVEDPLHVVGNLENDSS